MGIQAFNPTWSHYLDEVHKQYRPSGPRYHSFHTRVGKDVYLVGAWSAINVLIPFARRESCKGYKYVWFPIWVEHLKAGVIDTRGVLVTPKGSFIDDRHLPKDDLTREIYLQKMIPIWEKSYGV